MFSKPALFPKTGEPQLPRSPLRTSTPTPAASTSGGSLARAADEPPRADGTAPQAAEMPPAPALEVSGAAETEPVETGSRLIVGPNVKLKGAEILDCDTLVVEGRVEATMDSRVIRIAENGAFSGTVGIDVAEIRGRFEGELTARSQLIIHATGRVSGKIRYGKILIEEGGEISGDVQSLAAARDAAREPVRIGRDEPPVKAVVGA